jgi:mRNA-degrading endonuclease toxin of MazEF toxin-antitoxin module
MKAFADENKPEAGDIWLARFEFEEHDGRYKVRPVLVLEFAPFGTKVAFCGTQKLETTSSRTDVLLSDEEAVSLGLLQASRISFANHRVLSRADMLRKVGELGVPGERLSIEKFKELAQAVHAAGVL